MGLLIWGSSHRRVAVCGSFEAEQPAEGAGLVFGSEEIAALQFRNESFGDLTEVVGSPGGSQPEAGEACAVPLLEQVGELHRGTDEDLCVADVFGARQLVESLSPVGRSP